MCPYYIICTNPGRSEYPYMGYESGTIRQRREHEPCIHHRNQGTISINEPEGKHSCSLTIDADTLHSMNTRDCTLSAFSRMSFVCTVLCRPSGFAFPIISFILLPLSVLHHLLLILLKECRSFPAGGCGSRYSNPLFLFLPPLVASKQKSQ